MHTHVSIRISIADLPANRRFLERYQRAMKTAELRQTFSIISNSKVTPLFQAVRFQRMIQHRRLPTRANQFKDTFLVGKSATTLATSPEVCVCWRKHNDLKTWAIPRVTTPFSKCWATQFGDYFKREAITCLDLLTGEKWLNLQPRSCG